MSQTERTRRFRDRIRLDPLRCSQCGQTVANGMARCQRCIDRAKTYARRRRIDDKRAVFAHYGDMCVCCGEVEPAFLAIDHIDGDGSTHRRSLGNLRREFYTWIRKNGYPDWLQILCHNCNTAKHFLGACPHERY